MFLYLHHKLRQIYCCLTIASSIVCCEIKITQPASIAGINWWENEMCPVDLIRYNEQVAALEIQFIFKKIIARANDSRQ